MRFVTGIIAGILTISTLCLCNDDWSSPNLPAESLFPSVDTFTDAHFAKLKQGVRYDNNGNPLYLANRIYVKLKAAPGKTVKNSGRVQSSNGQSFGINSLDSRIAAFNAKIKPAFRLHNSLPAKVRNRVQSAANLPDLSRIYTLSFSGPYDLHKVVEQFASDPNVEYAEPVPVDYPLAVPNDSMYNLCQHLPQIMAEQAWEIHKGEDGSTPIIIGICDTGVDWQHPDLNANIHHNLGEDANQNGTVLVWEDSTQSWVFDPGDINGVDDDGNGYIDDFIGWHFMTDLDAETQDNNPTDYQTHGTHVAGIAAGVTNNGTGIASISWNVEILAAATAPPQSNYIYNGYEALVYLAENGADVINCSWGGGSYSKANAESIEYAYGLGAIIVASAGNDNTTELLYPGAYPKVVCVASVASNDKKASYSTYNKAVDISSPGGDNSDTGILSTLPGNDYARYMGTSMAGPLAAGLVGLVRSYHPDWDNEKVINQVIGTTDYIDTLNTKYANMMGSGRINAYRALAEEHPSRKQQISVDLVQAIVKDSTANNNGALEPGEEINIGFIFRNFAHFIKADNVKITLSSKDKDVEVINGEYTTSLNDDGFTQIPNVFTVKINPEALSQFATLTVSVSSSSVEIVNGSDFNFDIPVSAGGILIWEGVKKGYGYSGTFLRDFLSSRGFKVLYTNHFPVSLTGFDAVFLSFGSYGYHGGTEVSTTGFDAWMADVVTDYLKRGGKLCFEGGEALGWDQLTNTELHGLMGLDSTDDGTDSKTLDTLLGAEGSIMAGLQFYGSTMSYRSIDRLYPGKASAAFTEPSYSTSAIQYTGDYGQKVFATVYPVYELYDHNNPNCRYEIIKRVLNYFGLEFEYTVPYFTYTPGYGNKSLNVNFTDKSYTSVPIKAYEWDFNSDGIIDDRTGSPAWLYTERGTYTPMMSEYNGYHSHNSSGSVDVFDGESALSFGSSAHLAKAEANDTLKLKQEFTVEAWIFPKTTGTRNAGTIIQKRPFVFSVYSQNKLRATFQNSNKDYFMITSKKNTIELNKWQHVAVTYDGNRNLKLYINGRLQELDTLMGDYPDTLLDNSDEPLCIGNTGDMRYNFNGRIDELRLWESCRSQAEIAQTMNTTLNGYENKLAAYWQFEEAAGSSAATTGQILLTADVSSAWGQGWHPGMIISDLQHTTACVSDDASFTIDIASVSDSVNYKWFKGGNAIDTSNKRYALSGGTLTIGSVTADDAGLYSVAAGLYNSGVLTQNVSSASAQLTVVPKTVISSQSPRNVLVEGEDKITLFVEASGADPLYFQWYKDEFPLTGKDDRELEIETGSGADVEGIYYCTVANPCNSLTSDTIFVEKTLGAEDDSYPGIFTIKPNPVSNSAEIEYTISSPAQVHFFIYDMLGSKIGTLTPGVANQGAYSAVFRPADYSLAPGLYMIVLDAGSQRFTKPVIVR